MLSRRDKIMDEAEKLARKLKYSHGSETKWVSSNELQKVQRYFSRHCNQPDPWDKLLKLLEKNVPRSRQDWNRIRDKLKEWKNSNEYSNQEINLILGWTVRLVKYFSQN